MDFPINTAYQGWLGILNPGVLDVPKNINNTEIPLKKIKELLGNNGLSL